eukprot:gene19218-21145_t
MADHNHPWPEATIRKIDFHKAERHVNESRNINSEETVAEKYVSENEEDRRKLCEDLTRLVEGYKKMEGLPSEISNSIILGFYQKKVIRKLPIGKLMKRDGYLSKKGNDFDELTINTIFFVLPKNTESIYCFTNGTAHHLVKDVKDPNFSTEFGNGLVEKVNYVKKKYRTGAYCQAAHVYRSPTILGPVRPSSWVTHIEGRIDEANSLLEDFSDLNLNDNLPARVLITREGIRFRKAISLEDRVKIIEYLDQNFHAVSSVFGHVQEADKETSA